MLRRQSAVTYHKYALRCRQTITHARKMYPLLKAVLLILIGDAFHFGAKSPSPPPESQERVAYRGGRLIETTTYPVTLYLRVFALVLTTCHAATILLLTYAPPSASTLIVPILCPTSDPSLSRLAELNTRFAGAAIRVWCYRALGPLFTFHMALKDNHRLVTGGPYAYVRHPSYVAGWLLMGAGLIVWHAPGGSLRECGLMDTHASWLVHAWAVAALGGAIGLFRRAGVENEMMKRRFGREWEEYARRVPWKFVPYVL